MSRWLDAAQKVTAPSDKTDKTYKTGLQMQEPRVSSPHGWVLSELSVLSGMGKGGSAESNPSGGAYRFVPMTAPSAGPQPLPEDVYRHGRDINGSPKTWEGRIVTLAVWRGLSEWDRHGSTGQVWNGFTRAWEPMKATEIVQE